MLLQSMAAFPPQKLYQSFLFFNCYLPRSLDGLLSKQPDAGHGQTLRL